MSVSPPQGEGVGEQPQGEGVGEQLQGEVGVLKRYKQRTPESRQLESSPSWHRYSEHPCRRPGLYVGRGLVGGVGHFHAPPLGASIAEQRRRWAGQQGRDVCGGGEAGGLHYGQCSRDSTSQIQPSKATYTKHDGAGKRRARRAQGLWGALGMLRTAGTRLSSRRNTIRRSQTRTRGLSKEGIIRISH